MKKLFAALALCLALTSIASAQVTPQTGGQPGPWSLSGIGSNGLSYPVLCDQIAVVNIASATTQQVGPNPATGKRVYICNLYAVVVGTTPTIQLLQGAGSNCATSPVNLSGVMPFLANAIMYIGNNNGAEFFGVAGNAICITLGGTTPALTGYVTYIQI